MNDYTDLIERLRGNSMGAMAWVNNAPSFCQEAADALEAQVSRIAELEAAAPAQPAEPVATMAYCCRIVRIGKHPPEVMHDGLCRDRHGGELGETTYLYAAPPSPQPLTLSDEKLDSLWIHRDCMEAIQAGDILKQVRVFARAVLAAAQEKN
jgi:hypothetical protein